MKILNRFKNKNNLISVVLGSYNRLKFLKLAIESIRQELKNLSHEIFVIDGGSNDGALEWLVEQKDIITIVQHNRGEWNGKKIERKSWGYFINLGFKCAQGKYICMLSDDCLVVPGAIKNGYELFEEELKKGRKVGAVAFYYRNWPKQEKYYVAYTLGNNLYVNHGLYLNDALKDVGYVDEQNYFFYNGDGDLCLKMREKGYECIESENSYVEHYPHANLNVIKSNHKKQKIDNKNYFEKWDGIFYDKNKNNVGMLKSKKYKDKFYTAEKFRNIHNDTIFKNPELSKIKNRKNRVKVLTKKVLKFFRCYRVLF
ncbi:glycosyltransferase [Candidatus Babeliales bacterium]|nr:glycosyltransferase [Candidatus Babeliales bacterium]